MAETGRETTTGEDWPMDDLGGFAPLAPLLTQHHRLRGAALDRGLTWLLGPDHLPGVTSAYGLPVQRIEGLVEPMLGYTLSALS